MANWIWITLALALLVIGGLAFILIKNRMSSGTPSSTDRPSRPSVTTISVTERSVTKFDGNALKWCAAFVAAVLVILWFTIGGGKGFFMGHPHTPSSVNPAHIASTASAEPASSVATVSCADITVDAPIAHTNEQVSGGDFKEKWSDRTPIPQGCRIVGYDPGPEYTFVIKCQDLKGNWHAASTEDGTDVSAGKCDTYQAVELQKLVPDRTHGLDAKTDVEIAERPLRVTLKMGPATP